MARQHVRGEGGRVRLYFIEVKKKEGLVQEAVCLSVFYGSALCGAGQAFSISMCCSSSGFS